MPVAQFLAASCAILNDRIGKFEKKAPVVGSTATDDVRELYEGRIRGRSCRAELEQRSNFDAESSGQAIDDLE